jgi:ligand-binding sensor protein
VEAIQGVCAEALGIALVTIDMDGLPLTAVSNSYEFCDLILSTDEGRRRCTADWRSVGKGQVHVCHAGLLCASAPIEVSGRSVAITAGCQFAGATWETDLSTLASDLGLNETDLRSAADTVRVVPESDTARVSRLLQRITSTFSEIGEERLSLLSRLKYIAEMSQVQ